MINIQASLRSAPLGFAGRFASLRSQLLKARSLVAPLRFATASSYIDILEYLISKGADVNVEDNLGRTPLWLQFNYGSLEGLKMLIENGADANGYFNKEKGDRFIHVMAQFGNLDLVKFLVEKGQADIHVKNNEGKTALDIAMENGHSEVVEYLKSKEADAS